MTVCMPPPNATATCVMGTCDFACLLPAIECGGDCVDTTTDPNNCGLCGKICAGKPNATAFCAGSQCGIRCDSGYSQCGGSCVDTQTNKNHCGQCNNKCQGNKMCNAGQCG